MLDPAYAFKVFALHYEQAQSVRAISPDFTALELGPGDSLLGGVVSSAHGAKRTYLIDSGDFADTSIHPYRSMLEYLHRRGLGPDGIECQDLEMAKEAFGIDYRVGGLSSLREIPSASVDFVWSHAVLEHIPLRDFAETCRQMRRVMREGAVASHRIDLKDHLGGGLANLRFSERVWESPLMANSGFYTNRIRYRKMLGIFEQAGFHIASTVTRTWDSPPIRRAHLTGQFRPLSDEELMVSSFDVVLIPT
jgi:SAM-dependent methyltransferase